MSGLKKMSKVTFVSALFNINRVDGRKWDEYLKWFDITLKLKVPMVLYVEKELRSFIEDRRGDLPTKIITDPVDQIPFYNGKMTFRIFWILILIRRRCLILVG